MSISESILLFMALTEFMLCCYLWGELDYSRRKNSLLEDANVRLHSFWLDHWGNCHAEFKFKKEKVS